MKVVSLFPAFIQFAILTKICAIILLIQMPDMALANLIQVPGDAQTIQEGISVAINGDTVLVAPGTHTENLNFGGKNIVVASHYILSHDYSDIESTIIDGSAPSNPDTTSSVVFYSGENSTAILQGFTITGGAGTIWVDPQFPAYTWLSGGGIFMYMASPTIKNNLIINNIVANTDPENIDGASGGGLICFRGNPQILNNIIEDNQAAYGAGVVVDYSGAIIRNNIVCGNSGGQLYGGGGFYTIGNDDEPILIENNTIIANHSLTTGGAMQMYGSSSVIASNNIIWGNTQNSGGPIANGGSSLITYCLVEGGFGGQGNIDLNPEFADTTYVLNPTSPCIDAGDEAPAFNDPEDANNPGQALWPALGNLRNDMGVYGGPGSLFFLINRPHRSK